jgi:hypothetical protein
MKTRSLLLVLLLASFSAAAGCTIITPPGPDGGTMTKIKIVPVPFPPRPDALPPPPPLEASVLFVANLQRSSANLSAQYATIMTGFMNYLTSKGLSIANMGLIPTYGDQYGPRLLLGRSAANASSAPSSLALLGLLAAEADAGLKDYQSLLPLLGPTLGNIDDADLPTALQLLAASGSFDGDGQTCEAQNLIAFGQGLSTATLPLTQGGIDRSAFFDSPRDLFIVVYLQPLARRCALPSDACNVNGRSPPDIFLDTDDTGGVTWLSFSSGTSISPSQVVQVAIATAEGQSEADFETKCKAVTGFPLSLFDVIGPSANLYFTPLMAALNAAHPGTGQSGDFCQLIGSMPTAAIQKLGSSVAALATTH